MAKRLKDIKITHISLVKAGANGKSFIYKGENEYFCDVQIVKSDEEKGVVYGIVYSPDEIDSQGDSATKEEIEKAAFLFMKNLNINNVDKNHDFKPEGAFVCESWIVKSGDPLFGEEKVGSWAVGIKLESDDLKTAVKKGELRALSMAGSATKEDLNDDSLFKSFLKGFESIFKNLKNERDDVKENEVMQVAKGLEDINEKLSQIDMLKKDIDELKNELKKSKQENNTNNSDDGGIL